MYQLPKHATHEQRSDDSVDCVVEIFHDSQRVIQHCRQSVRGRVQSWMEGFYIDLFARIEQGNRGDVIRGIQGDEYLRKAKPYRG